jgi:hypothetical protein
MDETGELYTSSKKEKIVQHKYEGGWVLAILRRRYTKKKKQEESKKKKKRHEHKKKAKEGSNRGIIHSASKQS